MGDMASMAGCVEAVLAAYNEGSNLVQQIKANGAGKPISNALKMLEESLDQTPEDIEREQRRGVDRFGRTFDRGDDAAVITIQGVALQLHSSLLGKLRSAASNDERTDYTILLDITDSARDTTISALIGLRQRLLKATSTIHSPSPVPAPPAPRMMSPSPSVASRVSMDEHDPRASQIPHQSPNSRLSQPLPPLPQLIPTNVKWREGRIGAANWIDPYVPGENDDTGQFNQEETDRNRIQRSRHGSLLSFKRHRQTRSGTGSFDQSIIEEESPGFLETAINLPFRLAKSGRSDENVNSTNRRGQPPSYVYHEQEDERVERWDSVASNVEPPRRRSSPVLSTLSSNSSGPAHSARTASTVTASGRRMSTPGTSIHSVPTRGRDLQIIPENGSTPKPSADNQYLGFCKGAWRLQNEDWKSMVKCRDFTQSAQSGVFDYACKQTKCQFKGHYNSDGIHGKVWTERAIGIKYRWTFLAKSHVMQKEVIDRNYLYQCLFCVYLGQGPRTTYNKMGLFEHISQEHRGKNFSEVVTYRTNCVNDRICGDKDNFDINLFPLEIYAGDYYWTKDEEGMDAAEKSVELAASGMVAAN